MAHKTVQFTSGHKQMNKPQD